MECTSRRHLFSSYTSSSFNSPNSMSFFSLSFHLCVGLPFSLPMPGNPAAFLFFYGLPYQRNQATLNLSSIPAAVALPHLFFMFPYAGIMCTALWSAVPRALSSHMCKRIIYFHNNVLLPCAWHITYCLSVERVLSNSLNSLRIRFEESSYTDSRLLLRQDMFLFHQTNMFLCRSSVERHVLAVVHVRE